MRKDVGFRASTRRTQILVLIYQTHVIIMKNMSVMLQCKCVLADYVVVAHALWYYHQDEAMY